MLEFRQPQHFDFEQCLTYLQRSEQELLHQIIDHQLYKAVKVAGETFLLKVFATEKKLKVEILQGQLTAQRERFICKYIKQMFDLDRDLKPFYELAQSDPILQRLVESYSGYRIVGIPDLFESLTWAIIGQQINLTFAYTLKKRFVQHFGEKVIWQGKEFWIYPEHSAVAQLTVTDLRTLQFSQRKAEYIIGVAKLFQSGELSQKKLHKLDFPIVERELMSIRGVGQWTAHYVMMRSFNWPDAFPVADIGLHRALENQLAGKRPTIPEIQKLAKHWKGWEAYATFYLWRSLYD